MAWLLIDITGICAITPPPPRKIRTMPEPESNKGVSGPLVIYMPTSTEPLPEVEPHVPALIVRGAQSHTYRIKGVVKFDLDGGLIRYQPLPPKSDQTKPPNQPKHQEHEAAFWIADMRDVWERHAQVIDNENVAATVIIPGPVRVFSGLKDPEVGGEFTKFTFEPTYNWKDRTITGRAVIRALVPDKDLVITMENCKIRLPLNGLFQITLANVEEGDLRRLESGETPQNSHGIKIPQPDRDFSLYARILGADQEKFPQPREISRYYSLHSDCPPLFAESPVTVSSVTKRPRTAKTSKPAAKPGRSGSRR